MNVQKRYRITWTPKEWNGQSFEPDNHRVNAAEHAIQTFKNHFISGLCSVDKGFPLQLWCYLLAQAEITLNLLQTSQIDPSNSVYEVLKGVFNYYSTSLAPPGTKALIFKAIARRTSLGPYAVNSWYLVPAMKHYRCSRYLLIKPASSECLIPSSSSLYTGKCPQSPKKITQ